MTNDQIIKIIYAVLTTALETEPAAFPESAAYLAAGGDMAGWTIAKQTMTHNGYVKIEGHAIRLTDKGRAAARTINAALNAAPVTA